MGKRWNSEWKYYRFTKNDETSYEEESIIPTHIEKLYYVLNKITVNSELQNAIGSSKYELVERKEQLGVCLDTCHLNDGGYNVGNFDDYLNDFDKLIIYDVNKDINIYFKKNDIISNKKLDFENKKFPIVNNLDKYLKIFYGDYMTPPKEEERYGHDLGNDIIYDFKNSYRKYLGDKND